MTSFNEYLEKGITALRSDAVRDADHFLHKAREIKKDDPQVNFAVSLLAIKVDRISVARSYTDKALTSLPKSSLLMELKSDLSSGIVPNILKYLTKYEENNGLDNPDIDPIGQEVPGKLKKKIIQLFREKPNSNELMECLKLSTKFNNDTDIENIKGAFLLRRGDYRAAVNCFFTALETDPSRLDLKQNLASAYFEADMHVEARKLLSGLTTPEVSGFQNFLLGKCDIASGLYEEARVHFEKALETYEPVDDVLVALGHVEMEINNLKEAAGLFEKALKKNPKNFEVLCNLGTLQLKNRNYGKSLEVFEQCAKINPMRPEGHLGAAKVAVAKGQILVR